MNEVNKNKQKEKEKEIMSKPGIVRCNVDNKRILKIIYVVKQKILKFKLGNGNLWLEVELDRKRQTLGDNLRILNIIRGSLEGYKRLLKQKIDDKPRNQEEWLEKKG